MDKFLKRKIFDKLKTDYGKIKIEHFDEKSTIKKINITESFRLRMDFLLDDYESIKIKTEFIKKLFMFFEVKVTFNFKNNNCIIKFFENEKMCYRIEFKIENLTEKYKNITNCILCPYNMDKYETKLLNKQLLEA